MFRNTLLLFLLLVSASSFSQYKNVLLDPGEGTSPNSPSIAIHPRNTKVIVVAAAPDNVYYTNDGGLSWKKTNVKSSAGTVGSPVLVADDKGAFYYLHMTDVAGEGKGGAKSMTHIVCHRSDDGGATWDEGAEIGSQPGKHQDRPRATVDARGNIVVIWTQYDQYKSSDPNCKTAVLMSTSSSGKKWKDPTIISQTAGDCSVSNTSPGGAMAALQNDGKAFVVWSSANKIYMDRSFDGGLWLSSDILINEQRGGWDIKVPGNDHVNGFPSVLIDNTKAGRARGSLYLMWSDQRNGANDTDIWFTRSSNFGDNWTPALRVNNDSIGKHQFLPAIAIDNTTGFLYIAYYDRRHYSDAQTDVYLAYSSDFGMSFKNIKISESPFVMEGAAVPDQLGIAVVNGVVAVAWTRMNNGTPQIMMTQALQSDLIKTDTTKKKK